MEQTKLYFGTGYRDENLAVNCVKEDIAQIRQADMNLLQIGEGEWPYWEPDDGVFDFTSLHRVLSAAQANGMSVLVVPPVEPVPEWLRQACPGAAEERDDPDYLRHLDQMVSALLEQCAMYDCIAGYRLDTDIGAGKAQELLNTRIRQHLRNNQFITGGAVVGEESQDDDGARTQLLDVAGCAVYHPAGLDNTGSEISFDGDLCRGVKKDSYLVLKTQSQGETGQLPYPGQLRLAAYHHVASGAAGILYDSWHSDRSSDSKGILSHSRQPGAVYRECASVGQEFVRLEDHLTGLKKQNRAAIMVSSRSAELAEWPENGELNYWDYLQWVYDSLYRLNIEVDMIPDTQRDFTGYELLVTPCLYSAEDNLIWAIRDFVAGGGSLISTFRSFFADENGLIRTDVQPYGMTDVFGIRYDGYTVPEQTTLPEYAADVTQWMELLEPNGGRTIAAYNHPAWNGTPAAVVNRFGKGNAAYIGCYSEEGLEPILLRLLTMWHIPVSEVAWPVVIKRCRNRAGKPITFLLHYSGASRVIPSPCAGTELRSGACLEENAPLELAPWDVKILEGTV